MATPTLSGLSRTGGPATGGTIVVISGSGFAPDAEVSFGATPAVTKNVDSDSRITALSPAGSGVVYLRVHTLEGTTAENDAARFIYSVAVTAPPQVASIWPDSGPLAGDVEVMITGAGLSGALSVNFGPMVSSERLVIDDTRLIVVCPPIDPAQTADPFHVSVTTPAGVSLASDADLFTYLPPPTVMIVSPNLGSPDGGTDVRIIGTGLSRVTKVMFGGEKATDLVLTSDTELTVISPFGPAGVNVDVVVFSPGGPSLIHEDDAFLYTGVNAPLITQVEPPAGSLSLDPVTISGVGMTDALSVYFDTRPALAIDVKSDFAIEVLSPGLSPLGPGKVDVVVRGPAGYSAITAETRYEYLPIPSVVAVIPGFCSVLGGEELIVKGTDLYPGATVFIDDAEIIPEEVDLSAMVIVVRAPPHGAGAVAVNVKTPGGVSSGNAYTMLSYVDPPQITGIQPPNGPALAAVRISGLRLDTVSRVTFDDQDATFTYDAPTHQLVAKPPGGSGVVNVIVTGIGGNSPPAQFTYN